ncbi:MAG: hypothetical protein ABT940_13615 [Alphaproteobacteria bacterium]
MKHSRKTREPPGFNDSQPPPPPASGRDPAVISMLLSLFLLLLIFFVVLDSMMVPSTSRIRTVTQSLARTFDPSNDAETWPDRLHPPGTPVPFFDRTRDVVETAIPAVKVKILRPGNLMQATFHTEALFFPDQATLRPAQGQLLDRLVAALSVQPDGRRYEMEFLIGSGPGQTLPTRQSLETARAGTIGREMSSRGMPPNTLKVGIEPGDASETRMIFRVVEEDSAGAAK